MVLAHLPCSPRFPPTTRAEAWLILLPSKELGGWLSPQVPHPTFTFPIPTDGPCIR